MGNILEVHLDNIKEQDEEPKASRTKKALWEVVDNNGTPSILFKDKTLFMHMFGVMRCMNTRYEQGGMKRHYSVISLRQETEMREILENAESMQPYCFSAFLKFLRDEAPELIAGTYDRIKTQTEFTFAELKILFDSKAPLAKYLGKDTWMGLDVHATNINESFFGTYLEVRSKVFYHNGVEFDRGSFDFKIGLYQGTRTLKELNLCHLQEVEQELIERGRMYVELHKNPAYVQCKGMITRRSWWSDLTMRADGRVMIDRSAMRTLDSNYNYYFGDNDDRCRSSSDSSAKNTEFDEKNLVFLSPFVYGFSFRAKCWGEMLVSDLSPIDFRTSSYDQLVMDPYVKDVMFSLVEHSVHGKDVIDSKGGGCIFLLHGRPGVGKTLTAESIAEKLKRPLYMVSVGELGTTTSELEDQLRQILDVAARWNAVVLLDEADIYLEKRDLNIERNAMVGVFLRLLEYYPGILFLTTNRVENLDPAFYSRISLGVHYPDLVDSARTNIWKTQLGLYNLKLSDSELNTLAQVDLNGRQVKNIVRIAYSLATAKQKEPVAADFFKIIEMVEQFNTVIENTNTN